MGKISLFLPVLAEPKNALTKQYGKLFHTEGVELDFDEDALTYKLGARGLRSICEAIMTDAMFEIPSETDLKQFTISLTYAREKFERSAFHQMKKVA